MEDWKQCGGSGGLSGELAAAVPECEVAVRMSEAPGGREVLGGWPEGEKKKPQVWVLHPSKFHFSARMIKNE